MISYGHMTIILPYEAKNIINTVKNKGFECYAVGGSVRDAILGVPTKGWDFTTNAKPEEILELFPDSFYDNQFGTVGIKIKPSAISHQLSAKQNEENETIDIFEITTYRNEQGYTDYRHPTQVQWGTSLNEDLSRRDFTINAIATDGETIIDPYDGQKDLKKKIIKTVGIPHDRLKEDALRMMRAVRIASELGFLIEEKTREAIQRNVSLLTNISAERIRDELLKLLAAPYAADGIIMLKNTGILHIILPEVNVAFATEQKSPKRHHIFDVGTHSVMAVKYAPTADPIVRLATLLHDIGKPKTFHKDDTGLVTFYNHEMVSAKLARIIVGRLRLSGKQAEKVITLVRWHQFTVDERQTDSAVRRFIRRVGKENLEDMLALRIGDRLGGGARETSWRLELFKKRLIEVQQQPFSVRDLKVNGHDVMKEYHTKPGPVVGKILNQLFSEVEQGSLANDRDILLARMKSLIPSSAPRE